jgi:hypothetical protein
VGVAGELELGLAGVGPVVVALAAVALVAVAPVAVALAAVGLVPVALVPVVPVAVALVPVGLVPVGLVPVGLVAVALALVPVGLELGLAGVGPVAVAGLGLAIAALQPRWAELDVVDGTAARWVIFTGDGPTIIILGNLPIAITTTLLVSKGKRSVMAWRAKKQGPSALVISAIRRAAKRSRIKTRYLQSNEYPATRPTYYRQERLCSASTHEGPARGNCTAKCCLPSFQKRQRQRPKRAVRPDGLTRARVCRVRVFSITPS